VKEIFEGEDPLLVYPNPAQDHLTVESKDGFITIVKIELTTMLGETIRSEKINKHSYDVNISDLPNGIYIMTVTQQFKDQTITGTKKIIKR
jgi:hypothetical protein